MFPIDESDFVYPEVRNGMLVEVSNDPSRSDRIAGIVIAAKNCCADIWFIAPDGHGVKRNCWYEGDPRCRAHPEHFQDNISGVFSLVSSELLLRSMKTRMDAMASDLESLLADRDEQQDFQQPVEEEAQFSEEAAPAPLVRRRGRPPKRPVPAVS